LWGEFSNVLKVSGILKSDSINTRNCSLESDLRDKKKRSLEEEKNRRSIAQSRTEVRRDQINPKKQRRLLRIGRGRWGKQGPG